MKISNLTLKLIHFVSEISKSNCVAYFAAA